MLHRTSQRATSSRLATIVWTAAITAASVGAVLFFSGPGARRRRALALDRIRHLLHMAHAGFVAATRDLRHRATGVRARLGNGDATSDERLIARARAALGHECSHPHSVLIEANEGIVTATGDVLAHEHVAIARALRKVRGVRDVVDHLTTHASGAHIPSLQGGKPRAPSGLRRWRWSASTRLVAGIAGGALVARALLNRRPLALGTGAMGAVLLARAATNQPLRSWAGPFVVQKRIVIHAPVDAVFALFRTPERFPLFMTHVREVEKVDEDVYRWRIDGPLGPFTTQCAITSWRPSEGLAWASIDGATRIAGSLRFVPVPGGTRLDVELLHRPVAGGLTVLLATLLGRDPKRFLDEDLLRLKSLVESGKATGAPSPTASR